MSVFSDMARDAGTHIDAGISLAAAAAMHEADYMAELEREAQDAAGMLTAECDDAGHPTDDRGGCPCGRYLPPNYDA